LRTPLGLTTPKVNEAQPTQLAYKQHMKHNMYSLTNNI